MQPHEIARVVIGLAVAVALAVIAGLPRVRRWEQRLGLTVLAAAGFPLLLLGFAFHEFGVLSAGTVLDLRPVYEFGLGWIGMVVGMQVNIRRIDKLPSWFLNVVTAMTIPPALLTGVGCFLVLALMGTIPGTGLVRDSIVLAACAAVSAPANLALLLRARPPRSAEIIRAVTQMDLIAAFLLLAIVGAMFRPRVETELWRLPRSGWFLVAIGVGFLLGLTIYLLLRRVANESEEMSLVIGGIALAAGTAGYLALSVPVVCAFAGVVIANFPYRHRARLEAMLGEVERSIYLMMLFLIGTAWRPLEWQGWVLGFVFALLRAYGKSIGARLAVRSGGPELPPPNLLTLALLPESAIAIVMIFMLTTVDTQAKPAIRWAVTAVIVGSLLTEMFVQWMQKRESEIAGEETGPMVTHFLW